MTVCVCVCTMYLYTNDDNLAIFVHILTCINIDSNCVQYIY